MCKIAPFASTLSVNVSIITLVAISLDRFHVILFPLKPKLRMKQCAYILVFIWIISIGLSSVKLINFRTMILENTTTVVCSPIDLFINEIETIFLFVSQFLLPVVIISYTYFRIVHHMYYNECPNSSTKNQKTNKKKVIVYCR
jgi:hypothetical protein